MATSLNQESARIYQFPAGGRAALGGRPYGDAKSEDMTASLSTAAACSGSWYHAAAIEEAKPTWER